MYNHRVPTSDFGILRICSLTDSVESPDRTELPEKISDTCFLLSLKSGYFANQGTRELSYKISVC